MDIPIKNFEANYKEGVLYEIWRNRNR